ncbi:MAG: single-stranded-DNA-specific exonuclease RecJ [Alphaproteobacteria bacterium]|nr:single-stranded-DNA-specific exonuclease RecJ [Alphaproteobacteria bacterium]
MNNQNNTELSINKNIWKITEINEYETECLHQKLGISVNLAKLLIIRNQNIHSALSFLNPKIKDLMPNPSVLKDMDKASARIAEAIIKKQKIAIIGDYDVDGATSSSVIRLFLNHFNLETIVHIPEREEGYGPSTTAFNKFKKFGAELVITVDCGTSAFEILDKESKNFDIIVLDHHEAETKLPKVYAVVNPKRLDQDETPNNLEYMAAVGVVFLTVVAINRELKKLNYKNSLTSEELKQLLDLVALGTVCDVVPLIGLNRAYVSQGLNVMAERKNIGLKTLCDKSNIREKPDAYHLGFVLGPRINACGRVGLASTGNKLLCTQNPIEAETLVENMNAYNKERKDIEDFVYQQSLKMLEDNSQSYPMAFVYAKNWHQGVIGIVAGKLKERYHLPSFVMSIEEDEVKGSARSIPDVDLGALIIAAKEKGVITKGGGHTMAAGFSLTEEQIPQFREFAGLYIKKALKDTTPHPILNIDLSTSLTGANQNLCTEIEQLKPFGTGNPEPLLLIKNVFIEKTYKISNTEHIKCVLKDLTQNTLQAIAFNTNQTDLGKMILSNSKCCYDVVGTLRFNYYNNKKTLQFTILDLKRA